MELDNYQKFMRSPDRLFYQVVKNPTCPNIRKIHGLKQEAVENIYKLTVNNYTDIVKRVIIFGSAVTYDCWFGSDLDICIDWKDPYKDIDCELGARQSEYFNEIKRIVRNKCSNAESDIVFYNENDESRLYKEIDTGGVVIYE